MITFTNVQARQFILLKHGLLGEHRFISKQGALEFVRQAGCIQYDPIDVCGKNAELVLQSRVEGFTKPMLDALLYADRVLVDYPDKNLAIIPLEDWPYFERYREAGRQNAKKFPEIHALIQQARAYIEARGAVCSSDISLDGQMYWHSAIHWSGGNNVSRSVLEQMYSTGDLIIHNKKGTRKYYDLAEKYIPSSLLRTPDPLPHDFEHRTWRVLRRIGAVGLLWNRPSDAWLNIWDMKSAERTEIFRHLYAEEKILEIAVEGIKDSLYCRSEDMPLVEAILKNLWLKPRCELIAPLDSFMWDRRLIKAIFGFDYTWEIYTPAHKRKYGYYVLPLLYGDRFVGRVEAVADRKAHTLTVKHIWYEDGVKLNRTLKAARDACLQRFATFNACELIHTLCEA